jgi:hypothetical protein
MADQHDLARTAALRQRVRLIRLPQWHAPADR